MPIYLKKELECGGELGLWKINEPESYFFERMSLFEEERIYFDQLKGDRRLEYLSSRFLLHLMSGRKIRSACLKDKNGKPYLSNSDHHISFSHSKDFVAVIASKNIVGIDIQKYVDKIYRIKHKFLSESELAYVEKSSKQKIMLHVLWGAKESLYKAYGRKKVEFKTDLAVDEFQWVHPESKSLGHIKKSDENSFHNITAREIEDYMLVYSVQKENDA